MIPVSSLLQKQGARFLLFHMMQDMKQDIDNKIPPPQLQWWFQ